MTDHFFVFDVESIGLHGEGFAVGYVVVDIPGICRDKGLFACNPDNASGNDEGRAWVAQNVPALKATHETPKGIRNAFWWEWRKWAQRGAVLAADCSWPVEARFLIQCVDDDPKTREWEGPYPLHDLASIALAHERDPLEVYPRLHGETIHNPLGDAMQSARILFALLGEVKKL